MKTVEHLQQQINLHADRKLREEVDAAVGVLLKLIEPYREPTTKLDVDIYTPAYEVDRLLREAGHGIDSQLTRARHDGIRQRVVGTDIPMKTLLKQLRNEIVNLVAEHRRREATEAFVAKVEQLPDPVAKGVAT